MNISDKLRSAFHILNSNITGKRVPLSVYLCLTDICPNRCRYCEYHGMAASGKREMSGEDVIKIIHEMKEAGTKKLQLTGGEPLLKDGVEEILQESIRSIPFVGLSTSGISLPDRIDSLRGIDIVFLSLDGEESVHDGIRGKGAYKTAMNAARAMSESGIPFWFTAVLTRENRDSLDFLLETARKFGTYVNFVPLYSDDFDEFSPNLPKKEKIADLIHSKSELDEVLEQIISKGKRSGLVGSSVPFYEYIREWPLESSIFSRDQVGDPKCWAGKLYCYISSDGYVSSCTQWYGNFREERFNALKAGFSHAFLEASTQYCRSCIIACHLEQNLFFSLDRRSILNWLGTLR